MWYLSVAPDELAAAATELRGVGSIVSTVNAAAAVPTTALWPAAADEVSAAIAALFSSHAQQYQSLSVQVAAYHDQFVRALAAGGASYSLAEAASASPLEQLLDLINLPSQTLLGRPLIGDGADGTASAPNGGAGGLLYGNGGNGYDNSASAGVAGGAGGSAGLVGNGGIGGAGGALAAGGAGGTGGLLFGNGGDGGLIFGNGGAGGDGGAGGQGAGGAGGSGALFFGNGGAGGNGAPGGTGVGGTGGSAVLIGNGGDGGDGTGGAAGGAGGSGGFIFGQNGSNGLP